MIPECINEGGGASLIGLDREPSLEREMTLPPKAAGSLAAWHCPVGSIVTVKSPGDNYFRARVSAPHPHPKIVPFQQLKKAVESPVSVEVFHALPEKERFELVLEKVTEIGVSRIVPFTSMRSTTLAKRDAIQKKSHRWPVLVRKAALQCRRAMIPELFPVVPFDDALRLAAEADLRLFLWEKETSRAFTEPLAASRPRRIAVMIGPEGGFDPNEVVLAEKSGFLPVSIGGRLLRTETAAILATALVQHHYGDLG